MNLDPKLKLLLKYPEACALLGIGGTKLREEVKAKRIHTVPIGLRGVRFPIEEIYRWKAERAKEQGLVEE
jgi:excisionase family DNA binding protein